jgi:tetratricopeptide (TPR) repeat protein/CHAT domain-containing protein
MKDVKVLLQTGDDAFERGDYEEAIANYSEALKFDFDNHETFYQYGFALLKKARYKEAIFNFDKAIELKPDFHRAWRNRGSALALLGHYEKAILEFDQAIKLKPDDEQAWFNLGVAFGKLDYDKKALDSYDQALDLNPDYYDALNNRGCVLNRLNQSEESIKSFDKAIHLDPKRDIAWISRGNVLHNMGRYEEAIVSFDKALELKPDYHETWFNRGNALHDMDSYEEAMASFDKALELKPDYHEAWNNRGNALVNLGRYEEAIISQDKALALKSDYAKAWFNRGNALRNLGHWEEAIISYEKALEIKTDFAEAWGNRGVTLKDLKRYQDSVASYDKALGLKADDHVTWSNRGNSLEKLGRYEEAIASYDKALELKSDYPGAWNNRGVTLGSLKQYEQAIISYDKALELKSDYHEAWNNRGIALEKLKQYGQAIINFDKALELKSDYPEAWNNRGTALEKLKQYGQAIISCEKAIEFKPDYYEAWYTRGVSLAALDSPKEALMSYDRSLDINSERYEAWNSRGIVLRQLKCYSESIKSYNEVLRIKSDCYEAWFNRGVSFRLLGCYEEAITNFNEALRLTQNQDWETWHERGLAFLYGQNYQAAINNWDEGIASLRPTNPGYLFGRGQLYYRKGKTQYTEGRNQPNPFANWYSARDSYLEALKAINVDEFSSFHLTILQELLTVRTQLFSPQENKALLQEASEKLQRILSNPDLTFSQKNSLERQFTGFKQLQVDALAQKNGTQALELAEANKNRCLTHLRDGWGYQSPRPTYAQIQTLLSSRTAAIYWHLSPAALTTFILRHDKPPQVFQPKPAPTNPNILPSLKNYPPAAHQLRRFETWMQEWKQDYLNYRDLDSVNTAADTWRRQMQNKLFKELPLVLETDRICQEYLQDIDQLILIPHRDLHLLPLHALFSERFTISYLPSAQMGLELHHRESLVGNRILCVEDPTIILSSAENKKNIDPLEYAEREVEAILHFYKTPNNSLISGKLAKKSTITASFSAFYDCFHFTGHGFHNVEEPLQSALFLAGDDQLTLKDIFQLNLQDCSLVCLAACETGITSSQNIIDEYIGLVSGFLATGASHVISTLWIVEDESSSLLMAQFHNYLRQSLSPAQALSEAQKWLKTLTYQELSKWYQTLADEFDTIDPACNQSEKFGRFAIDAYRKFEAGIIKPPYAHPYYWAGFIITGKVLGG